MKQLDNVLMMTVREYSQGLLDARNQGKQEAIEELTKRVNEQSCIIEITPGVYDRVITVETLAKNMIEILT